MNEFLKPHQAAAVSHGLNLMEKNGGHFYNASEMGTGKTVMTIGMINILSPNDEPVLVVCPTSMGTTWVRELEKFCVRKKVRHIKTGAAIPRWEKGEIGVVSYGIFKSMPVIPMHLLIFDEAHKLKESKTKTWAAAKKWIRKSKRNIYLSGTPFVNRALDIFNVLSMALPISFDEFVEAFSHVREDRFGIKYEGVKNKGKLIELVTNLFMKKVRLRDVVKLDDVIEKDVILPKNCGPSLSDADITDIEEAIVSGKPLKNPNIMQLRRSIGVLKVKEVSAYVDDLLEQGVPVILAAHHKDVIDAYCERLKKHNPVTVRGEDSQAERQKTIDLFQNGGTNLIIVSIKAGGEGITLTRASNVVFAEYPWTYADVAQVVARANRIGQKNVVVVHRFQALDSVDARIFSLVASKKNLMV